MNIHHITKSLFVGAAIAGIGMSSGRAELKFAPAARQQLEGIIRGRLRGYYDRLDAVAPGKFTQEDLDGCLKEDLSFIMGSLLEIYPYDRSGITFFSQFHHIFYTSDDPDHKRFFQPFDLSRDDFKDPNEFAWKFFRYQRDCGAYLKSKVSGLLSLASNHGKLDIGNALVREGFAEKVSGTFKEKELDILDRNTLGQMMDIYYPEAAKSFAAKGAFNYSMYVFFNRTFPPTNSLYAMALVVFEVECKYRRLKDTTNRLSRITDARRLKEILASAGNILLACERGGVFGGDEHFAFRTYRKSDEEYLDKIKEACEHFVETVKEKIKELDQKLDEMLSAAKA